MTARKPRRMGPVCSFNEQTTQRPPLCRNCLNRHWPHQPCPKSTIPIYTPPPRKGTPTPAWPFLNRRESDRDASFDDPGYV